MIFLYSDLHIIWKARNVKICEHSILFHLFKNIFKIRFVYWYYLAMFKNLNGFIGLINSDNLVIVKFQNSKFDLKDDKTRMLADF